MKKTLKAKALNLENIFEVVGNYTVLVNLKGRIIKINQRLAGFLGYKPTELINKPAKIFWLANMNTLIRKTAKTGFSESEGFLINKKKQKISAAFSLFSEKISPNKENVIILVIFRDLTKIKKHLKQLEISLNYLKYRVNQKNKKLLEINNQLKEIKTQIQTSELLLNDPKFKLSDKKYIEPILMDDLFSELKIPLEYVSEAGRIILNESKLINQEEQEFLNRIKAKSEQVLNIVDKLKELEKINSHPQEIKRKNINLKDFYFKLTNEMNIYLDSEKWQVNLNYSAPDDLLFSTDETRFKEINFELVKYLTQNITSGEISIKIIYSRETKNIQIQFYVSPRVLSKNIFLEDVERFELLNKLYDSGANFGFVLIRSLLKQLDCDAEFKFQKPTQKKIFIIKVEPRHEVQP